MIIKPFSERLAVCSWSLHPENPSQLIQHLRAIGLPRVQLALDPLREHPDRWDATGELLRAAGIRIVLKEIQFPGWCCIEREAGTQRVADIAAARDLVKSIP